ncbi:MAG: VOC family protein [Thermoplasmata archaeon]|uniref:VOC family protein n=1 Tax=Candidatus Sysuiplasma superficiale TaxID=2823368 RepID=A0A8J8CF14_9ARCH|nr:VOC family protein [Candidatus Sysuiplasma superficiale]MBX8643825.1 VOC family protein [Candidatus Sysuiplasma superficiale]MCL4347276.1 VOC family protein [Candidatus Thermoplasmatota archaeon]
MKLLHTSINVKNMDESITFYTSNLGMRLRSRREIKHNNAEIAFLEIEGTNHNIELTWWKDKKDYSEGDQLDHIAFGVSDMDGTMQRFREKGVEVAKEPYSMGDHRIAFIKDPNGIWIELIEQK